MSTTERQFHTRNRGFEWQPHQGPFNLLTQDQATQYDDEGFFVLRDALPREDIVRVISAIDPIEKQREDYLRAKHNGALFIAKADAITFSAHLVTQSETIRSFSLHPVFRRLCRDLLGKGARLYWDQAVYKKPGNPEEFPWHQDNGYTYVEPQQYVTCWVPLTEATIENGCPWVVPGVHRGGTLRHHMTDLGWECLQNPKDAVPVPVQPGDIVVFSSLTPHRTGPNLTEGVRKAYILQYAPDGVVAYVNNDDAPIPQNDPSRQYTVS